MAVYRRSKTTFHILLGWSGFYNIIFGIINPKKFLNIFSHLPTAYISYIYMQGGNNLENKKVISNSGNLLPTLFRNPLRIAEK